METKDCSELTLLAFAYAERAFKNELDQLSITAMRDAGLDPKEGWRFDPRSRAWVRQVPQVPQVPSRPDIVPAE